jgi:hypothetical protein
MIFKIQNEPLVSAARYQFFAKKAAAIAPGPAWVPITLPMGV